MDLATGYHRKGFRRSSVFTRSLHRNLSWGMLPVYCYHWQSEKEESQLHLLFQQLVLQRDWQTKTSPSSSILIGRCLPVCRDLWSMLINDILSKYPKEHFQSLASGILCEQYDCCLIGSSHHEICKLFCYLAICLKRQIKIKFNKRSRSLAMWPICWLWGLATGHLIAMCRFLRPCCFVTEAPMYINFCIAMQLGNFNNVNRNAPPLSWCRGLVLDLGVVNSAESGTRSAVGV